MSMNAEAMKNAIISKMNKEAGSASAANKKFGDAILEYIVENMDVTYSWSGTNPSSGAPDPVTSFKATLSGSGVLAPSASFAGMLLNLAALIKASITISPATGFSVGPLAFNPSGILNAIMASEDNQNEAILNFCTQIISSLITSFPNPSSASGSHAAFLGSTTGMVIA